MKITLIILFAGCIAAQLYSCTKEKSINIPTIALSTNHQNIAVVADSFYPGKLYGGGVIYYVDVTGEHGLIAAMEDQPNPETWDHGAYKLTYARGRGVGDGATNTQAIVDSLGKGNYAAYLCKRYKGGGFTDWYLPSTEELNYIWIQKSVIPKLKGGYYWSSREVDAKKAWLQRMGSGNTYFTDKETLAWVRPVRHF